MTERRSKGGGRAVRAAGRRGGPKPAAGEPTSRGRRRPTSVAPLVPEPTRHGVVGSDGELPLFPGFVPDYEWVLGLVPVPASSPRRAAVVPWAALFLEAGSSLVVHVDLLAAVTASTVGATLRRAIERGVALGLRRPTRVRVGVPDHVALLGDGAALVGVEVVVGPVPEVEEVLRTPGAVRAVALPTTEELDVWRGSAAVTDAQLVAFFGAAEELRRGRYWRVLEGARPVRLTCPALRIAEPGAVIEGDQPRGGLRVRVQGGSLSVRFDRAGELSPARRRELGALRFAPPRGPYPVLSPVGEDGRLRRAEADDYDLATAALMATCRFASEYGALLRRVSLRTLVVRYSIRLGRAHVVEADVGWPAAPSIDA